MLKRTPSGAPPLPAVGVQHGLRLRQVAGSDAAFIVRERRSPRAAAFLGDTSPNVADQVAWLARQRLRPRDCYWACENAGGTLLGTIGLYNLEHEAGEWGRFLIREGSKAAPGCLLLLCTYAFEALGLKQLYCVTVAHNARAIAFYERAGFVLQPGDHARTTIANVPTATVRHRAGVAVWPEMKRNLTAAAERLAQAVAGE